MSAVCPALRVMLAVRMMVVQGALQLRRFATSTALSREPASETCTVCITPASLPPAAAASASRPGGGGGEAGGGGGGRARMVTPVLTVTPDSVDGLLLLGELLGELLLVLGELVGLLPAGGLLGGLPAGWLLLLGLGDGLVLAPRLASKLATPARTSQSQQGECNPRRPNASRGPRCGQAHGALATRRAGGFKLVDLAADRAPPGIPHPAAGCTGDRGATGPTHFAHGRPRPGRGAAARSTGWRAGISIAHSVLHGWESAGPPARWHHLLRGGRPSRVRSCPSHGAAL